MHNFLQRQYRNYCIIFTEQADKGQFNRGKLLNSAFDVVVKERNSIKENRPPFSSSCFIFHDIDSLPEDDRNFYSCFPHQATHLYDKFSKADYKFQSNHGYVTTGGITAVSENQYKFVNGHPNRIFGWGFEDHEMSKRLRRYNVTLVSNKKPNLEMEKYIKGTTNKFCPGIGMVRQEKYGYYQSLYHKNGWTNGKQTLNFIKDSGLDKVQRNIHGRELLVTQAFDGLNTLFSQLLTDSSSNDDSYRIMKFEIRPMIPKNFQVMINEDILLYNEKVDPENQTYLTKTYKNIAVGQYNFRRRKRSQDEELENFLEKNQKIRTGEIVLGLWKNDTNKYLQSNPYPLFSVRSNSSFVTLKYNLNNFGQFMVLPDYEISQNNDNNNNFDHDQKITFALQAEFQQRPRFFKTLSRTFYESRMIQSKFNVISLEDHKNEDSPNYEFNFQNDQLKQFIEIKFHFKFKILPPGIYLFMLKLTDLSETIYIDSYNIMRVTWQGKTIVQNYNLSQKFRSYSCDSKLKNNIFAYADHFYDDFCRISEDDKLDENDEEYMEKFVSSAQENIDIYQSEETRQIKEKYAKEQELEWLDYRLQKIESKT